MKLIYVAGPFRGPDSWAIARNVHNAAQLALSVWRLGAAAICPHLNTAQFQGAAADRLFLDGDIEILRRCDALITTADWLRSEGAMAEVQFAHSKSMPVFSSLDELSEWLTVQDEVESVRKQQLRNQYFNPRLGPMLEESKRRGGVFNGNAQRACDSQKDEEEERRRFESMRADKTGHFDGTIQRGS